MNWHVAASYSVSITGLWNVAGIESKTISPSAQTPK